MVHRYEHKGLVWIDLESPTKEEVRSVVLEWNLNPLVGEDLILPSSKPKVDLFPEYIYLILHFPALRHTHLRGRSQEIDFVIGKKFLITTRYDTIDPMHKFSKVFEVNSILDRSDIGEHAGFIFFYMMRKLYKSVCHELDFINDSLLDIERKIFSGKEKDMVFEISKTSREIIDIKHSLASHREVLDSFSSAAEEFFGGGFKQHTRSLFGAYFRVAEQASGNSDFLKELRETNNTLLSTKQNETMKLLAIVSFITFPPTLIASIFGMNTNLIPFNSFQNDFYLVIGLMLALVISLFVLFKSKGLL